MAAPIASLPKPAALDTNILLHLAEEYAPAHNLVLRLVRTGLHPIATQTVVQELGYLAAHGDNAKTRGSAETALRNMLQWGITPIRLVPVGNGICDVIADVISSRGLLPPEERNDAYIVIESGFCSVAMLLTWDGHLLDADNSKLNEVLQSFDLPPVQIVNPRAILDR